MSFPTASLLEIHEIVHNYNPEHRLNLLASVMKMTRGGRSGFPSIIENNVECLYPCGGQNLHEIINGTPVLVREVSCPSCDHPVCIMTAGTENDEISTDAAEVLLKVLVDHVDSFHGRCYEASKRRCRYCLKLLPSAEQRDSHETAFHAAVIEEERLREKCVDICQICKKRCRNRAALTVHMKTHQESGKYFNCYMCLTALANRKSYLAHMEAHRDESGSFPCQKCDKVYADIVSLRNHAKYAHVNKFECHICGRQFPRTDKLSLHMLSHNDAKTALCPVCGKQFKRNDKMKTHWKKKHNGNDNSDATVMSILETAAKMTEAESDFDRFIYKCQSCRIGFRRRGMLVNHMVKRHPDVSISSIPELNLPLLKTRRVYICQVCQKSFSSGSKRKKHEDKWHAGIEPYSGNTEGQPRLNVSTELIQAGLSVTTNDLSEVVRAETELPYQCHSCYKQYSARQKLLAHINSAHKTTQRELAPKLTPINTTMVVTPCQLLTGNFNDPSLSSEQVQDGTYMYLPWRPNRHGEGQSGVHFITAKDPQAIPQCSNANVIPLHMGSSGGQVEFSGDRSVLNTPIHSQLEPSQQQTDSTFRSPFFVSCLMQSSSVVFI